MATEWFKQMRSVDDSIVIYDYRDKQPTRCIHKTKQVPSDISHFKHYFANANPLPKGGAVWINLWIGHTDSADNIKANMSDWDSSNGCATYIKQLQKKHTVKEFWLMWSTINTDAETLKANTLKVLKKLYPTKEFVFAFVWNVVRSGEYSNKETKSQKGNQYVRALHVEVPVEQQKQTYSILLKLFSSATSIKIHEMKLRMVPTWKREYTSHRKQKIQHLINKHKHYLVTTSHVTSTDFTDIDYYNKKLKTSMRQILMSIETLVPIDGKNKCPRIFQSVDYSSYYSGYVLTFPTYLNHQATDIAPQLPSFIYWLYGKEILPMLTPEAAIMAIEEPWDPDQMRTISKIDTALDALAGEVEHDFEWLSDSEDENDSDIIKADAERAIDTSKMKTGEFLFNKVTDTDSVSTFATKRDPAQRTLDHLISQNPPKRTKVDDVSSTATSEMGNMTVQNTQHLDEQESDASDSHDDSDCVNNDDNDESDGSDASEIKSMSTEGSNDAVSSTSKSSGSSSNDDSKSKSSTSNNSSTYNSSAKSNSSNSKSPMSVEDASSQESSDFDEENYQEPWKVDFQAEDIIGPKEPDTNVTTATKQVEHPSPMQTGETSEANRNTEAGDPSSDKGFPSEHDLSDSGAVL